MSGHICFEKSHIWCHTFYIKSAYESAVSSWSNLSDTVLRQDSFWKLWIVFTVVFKTTIKSQKENQKPMHLDKDHKLVA